jgi:polysaccharide transporter, PST family
LIKKIKKIVNTDDKKKLFSNFVSLSVLQGANYLVPLIIVPYLFAVLGTEKYGLIVFAQSLVASFGLFVNYGFNLSATKEIAVHQKNIKKVSEIYSTVTVIKSLFSLIALLLLLILIFCFNKFSDDKTLYLLTFGTIIESILFPVWLFQGMERMKYITVIYSISKIIVAILIFTVINNTSDYLLVPILYFCGSLSSGIISIFILFKYFKIKFYYPSLQQIKFQLQEGWHLFVSNISINLYRNANILILGFITTPLYVGYYALAEKVIKALQGLLGPISETLYPYIANKSAKQTIKKSLENLLKISKYYFFILITIVFFVLVLAPFAVEILADSDIKNIVLDMRILTGALFFGGFNYLMGIIGLVSLGFQKHFSRTVIIAGLINVVLCFGLSSILKDSGAAIALSVSELVLTLLLFNKLFSLYKLQTLENGE